MFWVFRAANAPEAVGRMTAKPSVVLVNMSSSYCEKSLAHFCIRNFDLASEVGACDAHYTHQCEG
jgi:hypothetical protein